MIRCLKSSSLRLSKKASLEHMRRIRRKRLNGIVCFIGVVWVAGRFEKTLMLVRGLCMEVCFDVVVAEVNLDI